MLPDSRYRNSFPTQDFDLLQMPLQFISRDRRGFENRVGLPVVNGASESSRPLSIRNRGHLANAGSWSGASAEVQSWEDSSEAAWIPAFAGMTVDLLDT